jgi:hypothetical protein
MSAKLDVLLIMVPAKTLSYVMHCRACGPSHILNYAVKFFFWKLLDKLVYEPSYFPTGFPTVQVFERLKAELPFIYHVFE